MADMADLTWAVGELAELSTADFDVNHALTGRDAR